MYYSRNPSSVAKNKFWNRRLSTFEICINNIVKFIRILDPNKADGHDGISIFILKLCVTSISKPLQILNESWIMNALLKLRRKLTSFLFIKTLISNWKNYYWPVLLLPISGSIFEKIIFQLFELLDDSGLEALVYTSC